nr:PPC domain-containing protein [Myxococcota bacterium]
VLRDTAELACGRALTREAGAIELVPRRVFFGATITSGADDAGSCGGMGGPQQWYVVRLATPARLALRLVSEFDATLYVRRGAIDGPEVACRDDAARLETFDMNLPEGTYYVAVDGTRAHGHYRLVAFEDPVDPRAIEQAPHGELRDREPVDRELLPAESRYHASCGGTQAPEHLYAMHVERAARFSFRLASRFDSALYLLAENGDELGCRSSLGWPGGWRRSRVSVDLPAGVYWVVVDGESGMAGAGDYLLSAVELPSRD